MTLQQLQDKVRVEITSSHGQYKVTIEYRGKEYKCYTNNSLAYDTVRCWSRNGYHEPMGYTTTRQAYQSLWDECKRANGLR